MKISPARISAFEILRKIETEGAFSSNLLPQYEENLSPRDASLVHELVLGTLRKQIYLDRMIDALANARKLDVEVRIALRLAIYQLKFLDRVPAHSAINESVELVKFAKKRSATGFVNALLRRVASIEFSVEYTDELDRLSVETSHPRWLLEKWSASIGRVAATELARANNRLPSTAFRLTAKGKRSKTNLEKYRTSTITEGCFFADDPDVHLREMAGGGLIYFQDEASQMIANSIELLKGMRFIDVCASPGGKATAVAARFQDAKIFAGDLTERRVETLRNIVAKHQANVSISRYDATTELPFAGQSFDVVLVDAPCSGTGTIRHNPEIRYRVNRDDLARLPQLQLQIIEHSADLVHVGGTLIYTTCSLETEENERVVEAFLGKHDDFEIVRPNVPDEFISEDLTARTWPHLHDMDGFFIAAMRRR